jgi:hypothetical protein
MNWIGEQDMMTDAGPELGDAGVNHAQGIFDRGYNQSYASTEVGPDGREVVASIEESISQVEAGQQGIQVGARARQAFSAGNGINRPLQFRTASNQNQDPMSQLSFVGDGGRKLSGQTLHTQSRGFVDPRGAH